MVLGFYGVTQSKSFAFSGILLDFHLFIHIELVENLNLLQDRYFEIQPRHKVWDPPSYLKIFISSPLFATKLLILTCRYITYSRHDAEELPLTFLVWKILVLSNYVMMLASAKLKWVSWKTKNNGNSINNSNNNINDSSKEKLLMLYQILIYFLRKFL